MKLLYATDSGDLGWLSWSLCCQKHFHFQYIVKYTTYWSRSVSTCALQFQLSWTFVVIGGLFKVTGSDVFIIFKLIVSLIFRTELETEKFGQKTLKICVKTGSKNAWLTQWWSSENSIPEDYEHANLTNLICTVYSTLKNSKKVIFSNKWSSLFIAATGCALSACLPVRYCFLQIS